jgi:hypothetical protein
LQRLQLPGADLRRPRTGGPAQEGIGRSPLSRKKWQQKRADAAIFRLALSPPHDPSYFSVARTTQVQLHQWPPQPVFGLQVGIGPPSGAGTMGAATATYVQAKPTISNTTLTARFIVFLLLRYGPPGSRNRTRPNYRV